MKIVNGTAIYTGGGCYSVIGKLDNGLYFNGCNDWCAAFDEDTRTVDKETGDLACFDNAWCEAHEVNVNQKELYKAFKDFCERLDAEEPGITHGYEKFSNYSAGEVTDYIDFDGFDELNEENKMSAVKKIVNRILEGADIRKTIRESISSSTKNSFENWWDNVKEEFMEGGEEYFGFDPYDADVNWGVDLLDDGSVVLYGDVDGESLKLKDFKDMLKSFDVNVGTDVKVSNDPHTGGFKVEFVKITPEEFLEKVW